MRVIRYLKYAVAAPLIQIAITACPALSRRATPPEPINFAGAGSFVVIGDNHVGRLVELVGLRAGQRLLEIGCGIGRNATALHRHFGDSITYLGFDVVGFGIAWCRRHFAWRGSAYRFVRADLYNSFYNPRGKLDAARYVFPCGDAKYDLVLATSVFTHMGADAVRRYVAEAARVLRPGGAFCFDAFIIDDDSRESMARGTADRVLRASGEGAWIQSAAEPEMAVGYQRSWLDGYLTGAGFRIDLVVSGYWRGASRGEHYQDFVLARRE